MSRFKLGIDVGGSKIEALVLDAAGEQVFRQRVHTPAHDYNAILESIRALVEQADACAEEALDPGVGTPGAISPSTGLLRNSNTVCLNGRNLRKDLEQALQRPVRMQNDANCFVLSEAMDGAAVNDGMVFGVILGTGTGGGLVFNRQLITGPHAIAGEWGHNPMPWRQHFDTQRACYCGKEGCIETFLSGPGMAANTRALTGMNLNSREIVSRAAEGDEQMQQQMEHYFDQLARALAHVINIIDPDVIVLGGGMSNIESIYHEVPARLQQYVFSDFVETRLVPAQYGDSSGVRGAAWLWGEENRY
jgi:fructokinase